MKFMLIRRAGRARLYKTYCLPELSGHYVISGLPGNYTLEHFNMVQECAHLGSYLTITEAKRAAEKHNSTYGGGIA